MYSFQYSIHHTSKNPNTLSGDCYFVQTYGNTALVSIADGLGSGPQARNAAEKVIRRIEKHAQGDESPLALLKEGNRSLYGSRGSVAGIAMINIQKQKISYAGIGNITCLTISSKRKKQYLISNPGFLNGCPFNGTERYFPFSPDDTIILFSDGIELPENWEYIVTNRFAPDTMIQRLVKEMTFINDDATLIIGRWCKEESV